MLCVIIEVVAGLVVQGGMQDKTNYFFIDMNVEKVGNNRRWATEHEWCDGLPLSIILYVILKMNATVLQKHNWEVRISCISITKHKTKMSIS